MENSRRTSIIWKYFNKSADDQAKCNICSNVYSSYNSNLFRHLKLKHLHIFHQDSSPKLNADHKKDITKASGIWRHFSKIGSKLLKCEFCSQVFVFNRTCVPNLKRHIQRHIYRNNKSTILVQTEVSDQTIHKNRRNRSSVWKYFNKEGPMHVRCKFCSNIYSFKSRGISNLSRHIALKHSSFKIKPIHSDVEDNIQSENEQSPAKCKSKLDIMKKSDTLSKLITEENVNILLLKFLVKHCHTFQLVEQREFREFIYYLNPDYTLPAVSELSDVLDEVYNSKVIEIKESIMSITSCSISIDEWLSASNDNFISVTVHYINDDCELCSFFLDCFLCVESCTPEDIAEGINDICQTWEIDNKIVAVTSSISNIEAVANILGWPRIPCLSHKLISILHESFEVIESLEAKVDVVFHFLKKNLYAVMHLQSLQESTTSGEEILNLDISKKWNTTILMFENFLRNKNYVITALNLLDYELLITDEEFKIIEQTIDIVKPFVEAIREINLQNQINISKIVLFIHRLEKFVNRYDENEDIIDGVRSFLNKMKEELKKLLSDIEKEVIFAEATLLDPRFKKQGFYNVELYNSTKNAINQKIQNTVFLPTDTDVRLEENDEMSSLWDEFDSSIENVSEKCAVTVGKLELDRYAEEMLLSRKENPLKWWKTKQVYYPNLYYLMKKTLCIVGSTASRDSHYMFTERTKSCTKLPKLLFLRFNL